MGKAKVFTGARAVVYIQQKNTEGKPSTPVAVGVFDSCTYGVNVGAEAVHILGRYSPAEITQTSYEAVTVNCSGFRVIGNGAHVLPQFPKLGDLLALEGITLHMLDRQKPNEANSNNLDPIMVVKNCIPISYSTGANAKATSRIQITYMGTHASDESGDQSEGGAVELP